MAQKAAPQGTQEKKPNILVIWGDDIGISNLSCYSHGLMGYKTPNIDRIAREGMMFTDSYGEQSCTAGRSAFITGQSVYRTGLSKVGLPGAPVGMSEKIVTIAAVLKEQGYATGQFGKNHLGDMNPMLPTNHGFDEFFGNLYHLNAEEEPEMEDYPSEKDFPNFRNSFGPRGVLHSWATDKDDPKVKPRWGKVGKQRIKDTGPLNVKRMVTCDDEFVVAAQDFVKRQDKAGKPWFVWLNTTHMHGFTHTKKRSLGQAGRWQSTYHDTMIDHDKNVGQMLDFLDKMGLAENTFVQYSTDNGPHRNTWPDAGTTPFRSEKNTYWEGAFAYRSRALAREDQGWHDLERDRAAPRLDADLPRDGRRLGRGREAEEGLPGDRPDLQESHRRLQPAAVPDRHGKEEPAPGVLLLQRRRRHAGHPHGQLEGRVHGAAHRRHAGRLEEPFVRLRAPNIFNLRTDPYEFSKITSNTYHDYMFQRAFLIYAVQAVAAQFAATFRNFGPCRSRTVHDRRRDGEDERGRDRNLRMFASWNDGAAKSAIVDFVAARDEEGRGGVRPPSRRIATFDNDGTLGEGSLIADSS